MISNHSEGTFERLRRPQNCPPDTVSHHDKANTARPPAPPRKLALTFQRLLPILYKLCRISIYRLHGVFPSCIFTGTMISPSLSLRQCPNRYAFRAGRNLPDKEFRYLRTVIVTAAVYWGFDSQKLTTS